MPLLATELTDLFRSWGMKCILGTMQISLKNRAASLYMSPQTAALPQALQHVRRVVVQQWGLVLNSG
eukprot:m.78426 g.78426  ORF g.78426 m.78426 type:complete len:67 (-) comp16232_c0_seq3:307-507(-)